MKRLGWIIGTATITVIVLVIELMIISKAANYETREEVVFAKVSIDEGNMITRDMLEIREIASDLVTQGTVRSIEEAEAKVSAMKIEAGEMMLKAKLQNGESDVIEVADKSNRLFSIRFETDQTNGWQLEEGQLVDLICIPNSSEQQGCIYTLDANNRAAEEIPASDVGKAASPIYAGDAAANPADLSQYKGEEGVNPISSEIAEVGLVSTGKTTANSESSGGLESRRAPSGDTPNGNSSVKESAMEEYMSFTETKVLKAIRVAGIIGEDGKREEKKELVKPQYISFEVTEKEAVFLAYVKYNGKIELAGIPEQE